MKKLLVGGYYDDRIFEGEYFEGKTPFDKNIDVYTIDEALKLGFVENIIPCIEENGVTFNNMTDNEKIKLIEQYTQSDDVAGLIAFNTEKEAIEYRNSIIAEINVIESQTEYSGSKQDNEGYFREIYVMKP